MLVYGANIKLSTACFASSDVGAVPTSSTIKGVGIMAITSVSKTVDCSSIL